jgi:hypothetical protein
MIELHCDTCDLPLVVKLVPAADSFLVVPVEGVSECLCHMAPDELVDILLDAYQDELT